eukprot:3107052-Pyramimonas_sp.AAC.1
MREGEGLLRRRRNFSEALAPSEHVFLPPGKAQETSQTPEGPPSLLRSPAPSHFPPRSPPKTTTVIYRDHFAALR